nr:hypothetical protein [Tanacetum cinerariifolium]
WEDFKKLFFLQFFPRAEQERLKREYHPIRQTNTETSTELMQRFLRLAGFLGAAAGTEEEQAKNFQWGLRRSTLNHLMCMSYTDVAQVANAARNYEILHERDDDDTERPDRRQKSDDRHQLTSQQSSHRNHDHNNDRHGSDRRGGSDNHRSSNNNYSGSNNRSSGNGRDQRNRGQQSTTCGRRHLGECHRAAGTCFKCGQASHLQKDCKKNTTTSISGQANRKPGASGRVFAITEVSNGARNYEILHERDDQDTERPDKRQRSGDRHQPTSQQSSHRSHGHHNDCHGSDRRGGNDNHRGNNNNNNNNYSSSNNRLNFKSIQLSSIHEHDPNTTI